MVFKKSSFSVQFIGLTIFKTYETDKHHWGGVQYAYSGLCFLNCELTARVTQASVEFTLFSRGCMSVAQSRECERLELVMPCNKRKILNVQGETFQCPGVEYRLPRQTLNSALDKPRIFAKYFLFLLKSLSKCMLVCILSEAITWIYESTNEILSLQETRKQSSFLRKYLH